MCTICVRYNKLDIRKNLNKILKIIELSANDLIGFFV